MYVYVSFSIYFLFHHHFTCVKSLVNPLSLHGRLGEGKDLLPLLNKFQYFPCIYRKVVTRLSFSICMYVLYISVSLNGSVSVSLCLSISQIICISLYVSVTVGLTAGICRDYCVYTAECVIYQTLAQCDLLIIAFT